MHNRLKQAWAEGRAAINGWLAIPDGLPAEFMAQSGYDTLTVDLQHGVQDYLSMVRCFQAIAAHPVTPMVRVPWNEPGIIGKVLDGGAMNVICPMVNTAAEAEAFVAACKYPPRGTRSNGPIRAGMYGVPGSYQETANDDILCLPMIETREAVANLDAILDVPGVAGVYVGPTDLGFSHGLAPRMDREEPEILEIYGRVIEQTSRRGQGAGLHCLSASYAARAIGMGFRLVTVNSDVGHIATSARASVAQVRREAGLEMPA